MLFLSKRVNEKWRPNVVQKHILAFKRVSRNVRFQCEAALQNSAMSALCKDTVQRGTSLEWTFRHSMPFVSLDVNRRRPIMKH